MYLAAQQIEEFARLPKDVLYSALLARFGRSGPESLVRLPRGDLRGAKIDPLATCRKEQNGSHVKTALEAPIGSSEAAQP